MNSTMSEEVAGRIRKPKKVFADRAAFEALSQQAAAGRDRTPGSTSTTTPEGILKHDPNANTAGLGARGSGRGRHPNPKSQAPAAATVKMPDVGANPMSVRVETICRHPANRRPSPQQISDRAASMQRDGLLEPLIVRYIDDDARFDDKSVNYQLLSGETRWLAAQALGWERIDVRTCQADDQQALLILAAANSQRDDLDPIQTAELLAELVKPAAEGGGGMSHEEAAAQFSRDSASWVVNSLRLLELPEPWRGRLISREIEPSLARVLVPIAKAPPVLVEINKQWEADDEQPLRHLTREAFTDRVLSITEEATVSADPTKKAHYSGYDFDAGWDAFESGYYPILFDVDAVRDQLAIVELSVWGDYDRRAGKRRVVSEPRITNFALFKKLQLAELKKQKKKKAAREDAKDAKKAKQAKAAAKELTPAEKKRRAAEAAAQHAKRLERWRLAFTRFNVAAALDDADERVAFRMALFVMVGPINHGYRDQAIRTAFGKSERAYGSGTSWRDIAKDANPIDTIGGVAKALLWPTQADPFDVDDYKLPSEVIEGVAAQCKFDIEKAWGDAQKDMPTGAGLLYQKFFELHSKDQLVALGKELGVHIAENASKSTAVKLFTAVVRHLKLPSCLKAKAKGKMKSAK